MDRDGMITRGDLPHWYLPGHAHFVTYRLCNSIPKARLIALAEQREARIRDPDRYGIAADRSRQLAHNLFFRDYDRLLDQSTEVNFLADPAVAQVIRENLYHHDGSLYQLLAYCVMGNHVHVLFQPFESGLTRGHVYPGGSGIDVAKRVGPWSGELEDGNSPLSRIMHSLKSYTANRVNEVQGRTGRLWQRESYDHWVRDDDELERIVNYIAMNPVEAGLSGQPHEWEYSSAYDRYQQDGSLCAMVGNMRDDWRK